MAYKRVLCVLLAALCTVNTLALTTPQPNTLDQSRPSFLTLSPNGTLSLLPATRLGSARVGMLGGTLTCKPSSKYLPWTRRPSIRWCGQAVRRLPSAGDITEFRNINRIHPMYRMPQSITIGDCKVTVQLKEGTEVAESSWTEIGNAATQSILGCMKGTHTGGLTTCGDQDKVEIHMDWVKNDDPEDLQMGDGPEMTDREVYQALTGN